MAKSNLELVQDLFESRLNSLNEKIDNNNTALTNKITTDNQHFIELLTIIKEQTTKTNGRVTFLEYELKNLDSKYTTHLITSATNLDIKEINQRINEMGESNFLVKVLNRYPRQFIMIIVVSVLISIATIGYSIITIKSTISDIKNISPPPTSISN